jgi:hypothetical protein
MVKLKNIYEKSLPLRLIYEYYYFFTDRLFGYRAEKTRFFKAKGYELNLENPATFSEKLVWKKLYDRNPLLVPTSDKYEVRFYLEQKLGPDKAKELLIPLLYVTGNPQTIPFENLPHSYIVKATHASGWNLVVRNKNRTEKEIVSHCRRWLNTPYGLRKNEWAYSKIRPKIIIEELLTDDEGNIPKDFKFYMFHGKCGYVRVHFDRYGTPASTAFTPEWHFLQISKRPGPVIEKPPNYEAMLSLAAELSQDFDFVRVDLYNLNGRIYFGELTHYPLSGRTRIPYDYDLELGRLWKLNTH